MRHEVIEDWEAVYDDPIAFARGEAVELTGRTDDWEGHRWVWAKARERQGWVPDRFIDKEGRAKRDYDAHELSCRRGEVLDELHNAHGWRLCRNAAGAEGWVPERCLRPEGSLPS